MTHQLAQPLRIGDAVLPNRAILAPLAGVSDPPFRRICQEHGAALTYVEMLMAKAVLSRNPRTLRMMARHPLEPHLGVQVTGSTPTDVAKAVGMLGAGDFDTIDINMGCPVRKIVAKGCGSALTKDPESAGLMVRASLAETDLPLSVKCRIGFTRDSITVTDLAREVDAAGAAMFIVHGRTRADDYSTDIDYGTMRKAFALCRSTVTVGNGDVMCHASAATMVKETGCDAVMVSRGALGNPWIFQEIVRGEPVHPCPDEWLEVVLRYLDYHEAFYGSTELAAILSRKHLLWFCNGYPGMRRFREVMSVIDSLDAARDLVRSFARDLPSDLKRYDDPGSDYREQRRSKYDPKFEMHRKLDRGVANEEVGA